MAAGGMGGSRKGTWGPPPVRVKRVGGAERSDGSTATAAAAGPAPARGTSPGSPMRAPAVLDRTNSEERERDLARQRSREARERMEREGPIGEEEAMAPPQQPQFTSEMSFEALWKAVRSGKEVAVVDPGRFDKSQAFPVAVHMGMGGLLLEILLEEGEADEASYNQLAFSLESVTRFQATEEGFFFETAGEDGELTLHILQSTPVAIHCARPCKWRSASQCGRDSWAGRGEQTIPRRARKRPGEPSSAQSPCGRLLLCPSSSLRPCWE